MVLTRGEVSITRSVMTTEAIAIRPRWRSENGFITHSRIISIICYSNKVDFMLVFSPGPHYFH